MMNLLKASLVILFTFFVSSSSADDQGYMLSWIPSTCCVTNQCCWSIPEKEVTALADGSYKINSTGQIARKTPANGEARLGDSPDQKFYRCACDYDNSTQTWIKHQGANTRCLFIPNRGF